MNFSAVNSGRFRGPEPSYRPLRATRQLHLSVLASLLVQKRKPARFATGLPIGAESLLELAKYQVDIVVFSVGP
jgi:hypothetical protein